MIPHPYSWTAVDSNARDRGSGDSSFSRPPLYEVITLLPVALRVHHYLYQQRRADDSPPIFDLMGISLEPPKKKFNAGGIPLGGLGSGSIGRGMDGSFSRWSLHPGKYLHRRIDVDCFHIHIERANGEVEAISLTTSKDSVREDSLGLDCISSASATFHGFYPFSWIIYEEPIRGLRITTKQTSPIIPHNYSESCLPVGVFDLLLENKGEEDIVSASVMFTFQAGMDENHELLGGLSHQRLTLEYEGEGEGEGEGGPSSSNSSIGVSMQTRNAHASATFALSRPNSQTAKNKNKSGHSGSLAIAANGSGAKTETTCCTLFYVNAEPEPIPAAYLAKDSICPCDFPTTSTDATGGNSSDGGFDGPGTVLLLPQQEHDHQEKHHQREKEQQQQQLEQEEHVMRRGWSESESVPTTRDLISAFQSRGEIPPSLQGPMTDGENTSISISEPGYRAAAAVCVKKRHRVAPGQSVSFQFSLAWDNPFVSFQPISTSSTSGSRSGTTGTSSKSTGGLSEYEELGNREESRDRDRSEGEKEKEGEGEGRRKEERAEERGDERGLPRFYTRFVGQSGSNAFLLATYALQRVHNWDQSIREWQQRELDCINTCIDVPLPQEQESGDIVQGEGARARLIANRAQYSSQLFNELYYLADASIWTDTTAGHANVRESRAKVDRSGLGPELGQLEAALVEHQTHVESRVRGGISAKAGDQSDFGQWLYLEGHEYLMYNTLDVHFYAGAALRSLWPQIEASIQRDICSAVPLQNLEQRRMLGSGLMAPRKVAGAVPHDLGSPGQAYPPWGASGINAYVFQDVSQWRDLAPKFALQVWRIACTLNGASPSSSSERTNFLRDCQHSVAQAMSRCLLFDENNDSMIENSGRPDQTYDIWVCRGCSAYSGGLWLAALQCSEAIFTELGDLSMATSYRILYNRAHKVYLAKLWTGQYLRYDEQSDSVMADMLAGHSWCRQSGLPGILSAAQALSCYRTIFHFNVVRFAALAYEERKALGRETGEVGVGVGTNSRGNSNKGQSQRFLWGAVNGMLPTGQVDQSCLQSREVWSGTTYALAAGMLWEAGEKGEIGGEGTEGLTAEEREELVQMALSTAKGVFDAAWNSLGYAYATPEAWEASGDYRSLGYMRPLSIWQMQEALRSQENEKEKVKVGNPFSPEPKTMKSDI